MPIDSTHPEYSEYASLWEKCRDFNEGEEAVKNKGIKYLPALSGQTTAKYNSYKARAIFYSAASRTVSGLVGAVFRKSPLIKLPPELEYLRKDANGLGTSLAEMGISITTEMMITGRTSLFTDQETEGGKPYLAIYDAESLVNWSIENDNEFIVLQEKTLVSSEEDKFVLEEKESYRELTFDEDGNYIVRVYTKSEGGESKEWSVETIMPTVRGRATDRIPFTCISPSGLDFDLDKPPILDLVNVMEKHYQISADYANGLHVTALPTPYVAADIPANDSGEMEVFNIGTDTAWILPEGSKVGYIEFTGQGLNPIKIALDKLENMLAALGARLIETTKVASVAETAEGVRAKENAATAILSQIITSAEEGLTRALRWAAEAVGANPDEVSIKLNRDLVKAYLDANMLNALTKSLQEGTISKETYYFNLEEGGLTPPDSTFDDEQKRLTENKPLKPKENSNISMV